MMVRRSARLAGQQSRCTGHVVTTTEDQSSRRRPYASCKPSCPRETSRKEVENNDPNLPVEKRPLKRKVPTNPNCYKDEGVKDYATVFEIEAELYKGCHSHLVGVDEAGRGPLAGPVVAAACLVPAGVWLPCVADSKKLSEAQREAAYEIIINHPHIKVAVHVNDNKRIDEINILQAALECMACAVKSLPQELVTYVLVDGPHVPKALDLARTRGVVKGDSKCHCIGAASIVAKVTRDRLMQQLDKQYPQYGLAKHKGYPTAAHVAAIRRHGPCAIHRRSFAPIKDMVVEDVA